MLPYFSIPRLSNGTKIAVQKNNLVGHILWISLNPSKKRRLNFFAISFFHLEPNQIIYIEEGPLFVKKIFSKIE